MVTTYVETQDSRVSREIESKALVASDINELARARANRAITKRVLIQGESFQSKLDDLEKKMLNIESMLTNFFTQMNKNNGTN